MPRPSARVDATVERNEHSITRARDRQGEYVAADRELRTALRELGEAEHRVVEAERRICKLHGEDEALCKRLRCENAALLMRGAA